ncbi:hypothetical protein BC938DRAFT_474825 [Jimgerdemannia flammicorona]|uniref:F-box domain-containing protein n=1 Tax=Jimgerdemannia flammicorona TaxID=994334 RepID=A0A433Q1U8_9FUNG|nr:hypothetical protein BC938DRAFT_474825 [Jimgerdemannia flammicorona]
MNPVVRPPRREWATYREIARRTTHIVLTAGADDITNTPTTPDFTYNTFTCSICLLPTYLPVDQLAASLAPHEPAREDLDWLSRVVVLRHCPAFGHDLERVQDGRFIGPTTFEPARGSSETPLARGTGRTVVGRGNDPNKITVYKITVHRECYDRATAELERLTDDARGPRILVQRLEALRQGTGAMDEDEDEAETQEAKAMAREFGMMLKERAERVELSGVRVLKRDLTSPFKLPSALASGAFSADARPGNSLGAPSVLPPELIDEIALLVLEEEAEARTGVRGFRALRSLSTGWARFAYTRAVWRRACETTWPWFEWERWKNESENVDWRAMYEACVADPGMRGKRRIAAEVDKIVEWMAERSDTISKRDGSLFVDYAKCSQIYGAPALQHALPVIPLHC